jgi:predicted ArsR family transcriptional regulator
MLEVLGTRQQELLNQLLIHKGGLTVDELSKRLEITRNAIRQHLAALENSGLVTQGVTRATGGRPEQLYTLTQDGKEIFPRRYSWFAQLIVESIKQESGADGLQERLNTMGANVAKKLLAQHSDLENQEQKLEKLADIMNQLGYSTRYVGNENGAQVVEAVNCIFHEIALKNPEVCQFDIALLSKFTDSTIQHQECMATGGHVCRFKFTPKEQI